MQLIHVSRWNFSQPFRRILSDIGSRPVREKIMVGPYRGACLPGCLFYVLGTAGIFAALLAVLL